MTVDQRGLWGEAVAAGYLRNKGFHIAFHRYRCREGEIDLVAWRDTSLRFVEVKLRKSAAFSQAREAVTPAKQRKLKLAAQHFLQEHPTRMQPQFDVIEVYAPQGTETADPRVVHWENAFW